MSFIDNIREIQNERNNKEELVIKEIVEHFRDRFDKESYEDYLQKLIKKQIDKGEHTLKFTNEFWEYHSGCSATHFVCGGVKFELDYNEYKFKDIRLSEIQYVVVEKLSKLFKEKMENLGLKIVSSKRRDYDYRFVYYREDVVITWE